MYIPRIFLCGQCNVAAQIVGRLKFVGAAERGEFIFPANATAAENFTLKAGDFKIFLDGAEISADELRGLLNGFADYVVFASADEFLMRFRELYALGIIDQVVTAETLTTYATKNFFAVANAGKIFNAIHALKIPRTLDVDGYFAANDYQMFPGLGAKIEGITDEKFPAIENFYAKIYRTVDDCRYKFFDAILLTAEREPDEFVDALIDLDSLSENILAFVRKNSALEKFLSDNVAAFQKISVLPAVNGNIVLLKKFAPADFACYVVTHKDAKLFDLPAGYKIIHAGHINAKKNLGYIGDDTGENISRLNLYLNEITALYWIWRHTSNKIVGFVHYRRIFTAGDGFLTGDEAQKILRDFDIIVNECQFGYVPLCDWKAMLSTRPLAEHVIATVRKFIAARQPDYVDAFDRINGGFGTFCYEIFVARRKIFDSYCSWLFSFIVEATEEILATSDIANSTDPRIYRAVSFLAEHLLGVWLIKNRLRIKTLPIIFRDV